MTILAIESSCDETSAAVIKDSQVLSNIISSQIFHTKFGGVVPELASRAHLKYISQIVNESIAKSNLTFQDINAIAVTSEPGLVGSLIVGANFAKGLAIRYNLPVVPVNHLEGHIFSGCLQSSNIAFPFISLVVSGGHTCLFKVNSWADYQIVGLTRDDAAGEAFDKIAKMIGLPYPGGPEIDKLAKHGDKSTFTFPRSMIHEDNFDFSFSGLKTSVRYFLAKNYPNGVPDTVMADLAASVQAAIVDVLVKKSINAAQKFNIKRILISGGVSANSALRNELSQAAKSKRIEVIAPEFNFCMDNAAMIGFIAEKKLSNLNILDFMNLSFRVKASALRASKK